VLAAGLIVAAATEGGWYWWAGAIAAATRALINLSMCLRTKQERRTPPIPSVRARDLLPYAEVYFRGVRVPRSLIG